MTGIRGDNYLVSNSEEIIICVFCLDLVLAFKLRGEAT